MSTRTAFYPQHLFADGEGRFSDAPRVFAAPGRYIQGPNLLSNAGRFLPIIGSERPAVLISRGGKQRFGNTLDDSFSRSGVHPVFTIFDGECSYEEVERIAADLATQTPGIDALIGIGGGKCLDVAKCVAFRLKVPVVICPTIASTDAPCSAVSVMYAPSGEALGPEFFPNSPALVLVDTQVILNSPKRHLIAGMGDALATLYEARICHENTQARSMLGGRMTLAALAIAELCAETIYTHGKAAAEAVAGNVLNEALERVIEANTLLSGIGFESGGLSIAHAVAAGLTVIPVLHQEFLHGELVGMGTLIQLLMDGKQDVAVSAATFMASVGLPVTLEQLSLSLDRDEKSLREAMTAASDTPLASSAPFEVTPDGLFTALLAAHQLGQSVVKQYGESPYRQLHG